MGALYGIDPKNARYLAERGNLGYNIFIMIRYIEGTVARQGAQSVVVVVHNIGYLIYTPTTRQSYVLGDNVQFHTYLAVRETALDLYGFQTELELEYFELLLTIPKIGPKSALQILCQADPDLLATAIITNDPEHLHKVAGIGKKTAANIVTHLAGKIDENVLLLKPELSAAASAPLSTAQIDAIDALVTLGYELKEARTYVLKLDEGLDAKSLIRSVLTQTPMK